MAPHHTSMGRAVETAASQQGKVVSLRHETVKIQKNYSREHAMDVEGVQCRTQILCRLKFAHL